MDSKPNRPDSQLATGYQFVDSSAAGFDGAVLTVPSSLTGFQQTAFGYVQDPDGGTTMCFGGILTSYGIAPKCPECERRMHINGTVTGEIKHVPFGSIPVSIGFQKYLYRCPDCGKCISEPVQFQAEGHRMLSATEFITSSQIRERLSRPKASVARLLSKMYDEGILQTVGAGRATKYQKSAHFHETIRDDF